MTLSPNRHPSQADRRYFIGGSDARVIMGTDEAALLHLWREKRGEAEPPDYSDNLIVQLGVATEPINRRWYEKTTGGVIKDVQTWVRHPVIRWMAATLDGIVEGTGAVFEAKFMLPWSFSEEAAAEKQRHTWSYIRFLDLCGFRKRTPSPPPLSSMKSIPAASRARRIAASFASVIGTSPSTTSALRMVATPTFEARAKSRAVHRISARAALIWALEIFLVEGVDILYIV
jgi:YqaJ-like viral recombinase domain